MNNLVISVLGHSNSGKSKTWNDLFGRTVQTGSYERRLYLTEKEFISVFLVSGSPEEREEYVGEIIGLKEPRIVLCSMQYIRDVTETIDYLVKNDYHIYCQWLNPGYSDSSNFKTYDCLGLVNYILSHDSTVTIQDGKNQDTSGRINLIKEFLYGWACRRNLIETE